MSFRDRSAVGISEAAGTATSGTNRQEYYRGMRIATPSGLFVGISKIQSGAGQASRLDAPERLETFRVLVIEDDEPVRKACCEIAEAMGYSVLGAGTAPEAQALMTRQAFDLLLLDIKLPGGMSGLSLMEEVRTLHPHTSVVVMTAFATVNSAVEAMKSGARDYLTKPFALEELTSVLSRIEESWHLELETRRLRESMRTQKGLGNMIGRSPEMEKLYRILQKVAHSSHPVLILGESGTGKELVARSIHFSGPLASKPFVPVDCGSLVPTLIESELFGYVKGAFTGANKAKTGLLASADGGTVFLDEIGELPLDLQAKLLRALQEKEIRPVGATFTVPISARVLAATNRDLAGMVEQGRFRKDLYFRLNVVNLKIPPLRMRKEDVGSLAMHFLERMERETKTAFELTDDALRSLTDYDWPGNVRELENAIERACAMSTGPILQFRDLPTQVQDAHMHRRSQASIMTPHNDGTQAPKLVKRSKDPNPEVVLSIAEMERQAILGTIRQLKGDKLMAAKLLGIGKTTLYRKLKEYGIPEEAQVAQ